MARLLCGSIFLCAVATALGASGLAHPKRHLEVPSQFRPSLNGFDGQEDEIGAAQGSSSIFLNVKDAPYHAKGDGHTDDTAAIQKALEDAYRAGGGLVFLPTSTYYLAGTLTVGPQVTLRGVADAPFRVWGTATKAVGSTLLATSMDAPFVFLQGPNAGVWGFTVFYPNQVSNTTVPKAYPPTIQGISDNLNVQNMFLVNPYIAIDFATHPCGRHLISNVQGEPLLTGITVDQCFDIGRIRHIHFWPFWTNGKKIAKFREENSVAFHMLRTDWEIIEDVFCFDCGTGFLFGASKKVFPASMNGQVTDANFDSVNICVDVIAIQLAGILIHGLNCANDGRGNDRVMIRSQPNATDPSFPMGPLSILHASFWSCPNCIINVAKWNNPNSVFTLSNSLIQVWNYPSPAVHIMQGQGIISNNNFRFQGKPGVAVHFSSKKGGIAIGNNLNSNTIVTDPDVPHEVGYNLK